MKTNWWLWSLLPLFGIVIGLAVRTGVREVEIPQDAPGERLRVHPDKYLTPVAFPWIDARLASTGQEARLSCSTCHSLRTTPDLMKSSDELRTFHRGISFFHGDLSCQSCHNDRNYNTLRLSDGEAVPFSNARKVCAQCHPAQAEAFMAGAHGGMQGFWDSSRGPKIRNDCTRCHNPHAPAFPVFSPAPRPADRFPPAADDGGHE